MSINLKMAESFLIELLANQTNLTMTHLTLFKKKQDIQAARL